MGLSWDIVGKLKSILRYPSIWLAEGVETTNYLAILIIFVKFCINDNL